MPVKAYKKHPKLSFSSLRWPAGADRCPPEDRKRGTFKVASPQPIFVSDDEGFISLKPGSLIKKAVQTFKTFCKRAEILDVEISCGFEGDEQALDENFAEPGVVIFYRWGLKDHFLAMDCFTRGICNLKAAIEVVQGYYAVTRYPHAQTDFEHLSSFREHRMVEQLPPIKSKLFALADWRQILEISPEQVDFRTGLPFDRSLAAQKRNELAIKYHPDRSSCPDKGESMQVIQDALEFVLNGYEHQDALSPEEKERKAASMTYSAKKMEAKKRQEADDISAALADLDNEDREPSMAELSAIEQEDQEDEDDSYVEDIYDEGPSTEELLFDSADDEESDDEEEDSYIRQRTKYIYDDVA